MTFKLVKTEVAIQDLTDRALRRIERKALALNSKSISQMEFVLFAHECIGAAKQSLEAVTTAAIPAERLHNEILAGMSARGLA